MIITRIDGGLGNQLFQYAYGLYLATQHQVPLLLDINSYAHTPAHGYLLDRLNISARPLTAAQQHLLPRRYRQQQPASLRIGDLFGLGQLRRHKEATFGFQHEHLLVPDQRYLVGYWQSERFFPGLRLRLLDEFQLREPLSAPSQRVSEQMHDCRSVALHVRRGDYLTGAAASIYSHVELDYYQRSVSDWAQNWHRVKAFVFSNDISWCRQYLQLPCPVTYVDHNTAATAHEDLELLRQAECCVIANSTFSWWGAWLNDNPHKVIYAPDEWFRPGTHDATHLVPDNWKRCQVPFSQSNRREHDPIANSSGSLRRSNSELDAQGLKRVS